jgi:tryptophan halogenase
MDICIIGTGVSGLMTACELLKLNFIKNISIIGSSTIPSIKVGESSTYSFYDFIKNNFNIREFVQASDASVKYGVYYQNWSKRNFIHHFDSNNSFSNSFANFRDFREYYPMLANKDPDIHIHNLIGNKMWNFIQRNEVSLNTEEYHHSWHFDAGKIKIFLKNYLKKSSKISFFDDIIVDCKFLEDSKIEYIVGSSKRKYLADYFVNCCGNNDINEKVFKEEYVSMSSYLLTNKALVYPLKYTNKKEQFHPYTVAKTMKHGWRWITPTQSRIGTGYVFSNNHISVDEATNEFLEDIGDKTIEPFLVDFNPKYNKRQFKLNSCTIGMSSGFLEPLDAPGLAFTDGSIKTLIKFLTHINDIKFENDYIKAEKLKICNSINSSSSIENEWWCSFILHQYKTCYRNDTQFWIDHKNVKYDFYDKLIDSFEFIDISLIKSREYEMFFKTTAGKDIQWKSKISQKPFPINELDTETIHHLDYIQSFYD